MLYRERNCIHPNIFAGADCGYCPDCGEFINNKWYLCRCACCNVKRKGIIKFDKIIPDTKFCSNCGCSEFVLEELPEINFINIYFAVLKKEVQRKNRLDFASIQSWVSNVNETVTKGLLTCAIS